MSQKSDLPPIDPKPIRTFNWTRAVLVLSLAANIAVIGLVIGTVLSNDKRDARRGPPPSSMVSRDFGFGPYVGAFADQDKRSLGKDFVRKAGDRTAVRARLETQFQEIQSILRASPFDAERFEALILDQTRQLAQGQEIGAQLVAQKIAQMSDAERITYAERLEHMLKNPPRPPKMQKK